MANKPSDLVKAPYKPEVWTEEQLEEFKKCQDPINGPTYFMDNYFYIQHPTRGAIQYHPYDYQRRLIDVYHKYRFSIALMPRQSGKSTSAAGYLLWYAMFVPDSTILISAHVHKGAQEIMTRIRYAYENCPDFIRAGATSYNKGSLEFDNGSRIVSTATTENTGRGMSITLLYCDEFAFVRGTIGEEFWTSISPTLSTGGKAIITSTPNSDEDKFAQIWRQANDCRDAYGNETEVGINGFKAYKAEWWEHPERDDAWADQQRAALGEERFRREMNCEFIIYDETLINSMILTDLRASEPVMQMAQVRWFKEPQKGKLYIVALDPSLGTGGDPAAIQVFEAQTAEQVAEWRHNKTSIVDQVRILVDIVKYINTFTEDGANSIYYSVENNAIGEAALVAIANYGEENIPGYFLRESGGGRASNSSRKFRGGFNTTHKSKITACSKLKEMVEKRRMKIHSQGLLSELKTFVAIGNTFKAKQGYTDDLVMSTILAIRMMTELQNHYPEMEKHMRDNENDYTAPMPFISSSYSGVF